MSTVLWVLSVEVIVGADSRLQWQDLISRSQLGVDEVIHLTKEESAPETQGHLTVGASFQADPTLTSNDLARQQYLYHHQ